MIYSIYHELRNDINGQLEMLCISKNSCESKQA
jgi:hypothetical protein